MFEALVAEAPPAPPLEKRCLTFDLLLHLLEVVDPMQATEGESSDDVFGPPRRRTHRTYLGRIDGTGPGPILGGGHRFAGPCTWAAGGMQFQRQLQRASMVHVLPATRGCCWRWRSPRGMSWSRPLGGARRWGRVPTAVVTGGGGVPM
jgi:hypothetical protein